MKTYSSCFSCDEKGMITICLSHDFLGFDNQLSDTLTHFLLYICGRIRQYIMSQSVVTGPTNKKIEIETYISK